MLKTIFIFSVLVLSSTHAQASAAFWDCYKQLKIDAQYSAFFKIADGFYLRPVNFKDESEFGFYVFNEDDDIYHINPSAKKSDGSKINNEDDGARDYVIRLDIPDHTYQYVTIHRDQNGTFTVNSSKKEDEYTYYDPIRAIPANPTLSSNAMTLSLYLMFSQLTTQIFNPKYDYSKLIDACSNPQLKLQVFIDFIKANQDAESITEKAEKSAGK